MNIPIPLYASVNAAKVDVATLVRKLNNVGIHVYCPKPVDQDKIVEVHVSIFDGMDIKPHKG